eukprot:CAMPEP_0185909574 /NCGR_PEP_ID=MMETSP0196C-20130402/13539_1 /TAXON_ID=2932 /ORGANISM="Alexandrium fundyense, Strain CCMP1719" /LENGTH=32 /DNA_ID= /DNA_START= /DNA_END= /DNA_ORIENTATION=
MKHGITTCIRPTRFAILLASKVPIAHKSDSDA